MLTVENVGLLSFHTVSVLPISDHGPLLEAPKYATQNTSDLLMKSSDATFYNCSDSCTFCTILGDAISEVLASAQKRLVLLRLQDNVYTKFSRAQHINSSHLERTIQK